MIALYLRRFGKPLKQNEFSEGVVKIRLSAGPAERESRRGGWVAVRHVVRADDAVGVPDPLLEAENVASYRESEADGEADSGLGSRSCCI